jgi:hypothetical protein
MADVTYGSVQGFNVGNGVNGVSLTVSDGDFGGLFSFAKEKLGLSESSLPGPQLPSMQLQIASMGVNQVFQYNFETGSGSYALGTGLVVGGEKPVGGSVFVGAGVKDFHWYATVQGQVTSNLKLGCGLIKS